jgi:hypothetical protein
MEMQAASLSLEDIFMQLTQDEPPVRSLDGTVDADHLENNCMRNIWVIAKREFKLYFISPIAYAVMFLILFVLGLIFYSSFFCCFHTAVCPQ